MARLIATDPKFARPEIQRIMKQYDSENPLQWRGYMREESTDLAFERISSITGFGTPTYTPEGTDINVDDMFSPFDLDVTPVKYSLGFEISDEAEYTDQYKVLSRPTEGMVEAMNDFEDLTGANVFNNGFTTAVPTLDGVAFFSNAHTLQTGSASNLGSAALGMLNLESAIQQTRYTLDWRGKIWRYTQGGFHIVVPPALEQLALQITESTNQPFVADNTKNTARMSARSVMVLPHLTDQNNWFLVPDAARKRGIVRTVRMGRKLLDERFNKRMVTFYGIAKEWVDHVEEWRGHFGASVA